MHINQTIGILLYMPFFFSAIIYINSFERLKKFSISGYFSMVYIAIKGILGKVSGVKFLADENDFSTNEYDAAIWLFPFYV